VLEVAIGYGHTRLSTADVLRARAAVKYAGKGPTDVVVSVDLWLAGRGPQGGPALSGRGAQRRRSVEEVSNLFSTL
jgi:hypothetical protein